MSKFVRGEVNSSKMYAHKKYKFNKNLLDIIQKEKGVQLDLMNHQIEQVLQQVYSGDYTSMVKKLTNVDKEKLIVNMKDVSPINVIYQGDTTEIVDKKYTSISNFLIENFTQEEVDGYIEYCLREFYKPGIIDISHGVGLKINTSSIIMFLDKMLVEMLMGFVIVKDYMDDAINILDKDEKDIEYEKQTTMSLNPLRDEYMSLKKEVEDMDFTYVYENNDLLVFATNDTNTLDELKTKINLPDELIPKEYFDWGKTDLNDTHSLREKLNKAVEKIKKVLKEQDDVTDNIKVMEDGSMLDSMEDSFDMMGKGVLKQLIGLTEDEQREKLKEILKPFDTGVLSESEKETVINDIIETFNNMSDSELDELTNE